MVVVVVMQVAVRAAGHDPGAAAPAARSDQQRLVVPVGRGEQEVVVGEPSEASGWQFKRIKKSPKNCLKTYLKLKFKNKLVKTALRASKRVQKSAQKIAQKMT